MDGESEIQPPLQMQKPPQVIKDYVIYPETLSLSFADTAVEQGYLDRETARQLHAQSIHSPDPIGVAALKRGLLNEEQVRAIDAARKATIYINSRFMGMAAAQTWISDIKRIDPVVEVVSVDAREIAILRNQQVKGYGAEKVGFDNLSLARQVLIDCAAVGGTDLHVLQREDHVELQVRVKNDLKTMRHVVLNKDGGDKFVRAMVTGLATVRPDTFNPLEVQDAQILGSSLPGTGLLSIRIIRGPMNPVELGGAFLVARLLYAPGHRTDPREFAAAYARLGLVEPDKPEGSLRLGDMGFKPEQVEMLIRLIRRASGLILVTGPTGSGKTTTLYELMTERLRLFPETRLVTIENPPEYPLPWGIQLAAESEQFTDYLRYALRMDPDVIMPSEIRGANEAIASFQAALTGHLVPSTLHVSDPFEVFPRLEALEEKLLAPRAICNHRQLIGLVAQRRVPILCDCAKPLATKFDSYPTYMRSALLTWEKKRPYGLSKVRVRGDGCAKCGGQSIIREQAVAEVVVTSEQMMADCVSLGIATAARNHRQRKGSDKTMIEHAMDLVLDGLLDPSDAERQVDEIPNLEEA
jgi:type II secretory ATPase GspE/PulE/Tfp pilus assembly ATPase PilB-like protein